MGWPPVPPEPNLLTWFAVYSRDTYSEPLIKPFTYSTSLYLPLSLFLSLTLFFLLPLSLSVFLMDSARLLIADQTLVGHKLPDDPCNILFIIE